MLKIFQVEGEPNWGERFIVVTRKKEILTNVLLEKKDLLSLTESEWNELLNPSPPNKLVYNYFRKLHNAFKTNSYTTRKYYSAFLEILRFLKEKWEVNPSNYNSEKNKLNKQS